MRLQHVVGNVFTLGAILFGHLVSHLRAVRFLPLGVDAPLSNKGKPKFDTSTSSRSCLTRVGLSIIDELYIKI